MENLILLSEEAYSFVYYFHLFIQCLKRVTQLTIIAGLPSAPSRGRV